MAITVTASPTGDAPLNWRWQLTLTASATSVRVANLDDTDELGLTVGPVSPGDVVVIDGDARTVTVDGVDGIGLVLPGSGWPPILPSAGTFTIDGASVAQLTHRPLWL